MTRLIDAAPLLEVTIAVGAGLVVPQALPAGGRFLKLSANDTVLAAPAAGLIARVQRAVPLAVRAAYDDRHYGAELSIPQNAPLPDTLELDNLAGPNSVDVDLEVFGVFDPTGTSLMQLGGQPQWFNRQPEIALGPLAPGAQGDFDRGILLPVGTTHVVVAVDEQAGMHFRLEYYDATLVLQHAENFTNAVFPLGEQANYLRAQFLGFRLRVLNTGGGGAPNVAGVVYPLIQMP